VNEKQNINRILEDLTDIETTNAIIKQKERMSKKYKDMMAAEREVIQARQQQLNGSANVGISGENSQNLDVYDYCDMMMKEMNDKQRENRGQKNPNTSRTGA